MTTIETRPHSPISSAAEGLTLRPYQLSRAAGGERLLLATLVVALLLASLAPILRLAWEAVPFDARGWSVLQRVATAPATWRALGNSLELGAGATLVSALLGGGFALLAGATDIRGKGLLAFCFLLPLMIPPQVTAIAWIQLLGPGSPLLKALGLAPPPGTPNPLYGNGGIMLLMGIEHSALVFLSLRAGLRAVPRDIVDAARSAGAGTGAILREIILPLTAPAFGAGIALAFVSALGNFGIPALLGIPAGISVLPTLIYQRLAGFGVSALTEASILSVLVGAVACLGVALQHRLQARSGARMSARSGGGTVLALGRARPLAGLVCWLVLAAILAVPLVALVSTALVRVYGLPLAAANLTLDNFAAVLALESVGRGFRNSMLLGGAAALTLTLLGLLAGYLVVWRRSRILRFAVQLAELPLAVPGTVLAIACILLFLRPLPLIGIGLYGTLWLIFVAYLARFLPLALRPAIAAYRSLDPAMEEAARSCGAGLVARLAHIVAPLVAPAAAAGAILVFLTAFSELTVSVLLWSSGRETVGVTIFSLQEGGGLTAAAALSSLTVLAVILLMMLADLLGRRLPPGTVPWRG